MERVLRLPVNEFWYQMIINGELTYDYRLIKSYWIKRLENKEYDIVEFYHRFKKDIKPIRYKFNKITKGTLTDYNMKVYIIHFGNRVN